jgi:hypothetical protein
MTGKFWNKRREMRCRIRGTAAVEPLWALVERQTEVALPALSTQVSDAS